MQLYDWVLCKVYEEELSAKKAPELNNQGNAADEEVTGEQLHPHVGFFNDGSQCGNQCPSTIALFSKSL